MLSSWLRYHIKLPDSQLPSNPANIRLDEDVFRLCLQKTSSRRLDQDEYVHLSLTSPEDVLVKTNIFVLAIRLQDVFKTFSRRLQDVFKTFSRRLQDVLQKRLQDIFKTSSRRFEDVFKTSCKDIFKMFSRHTIKLICSS